MRSTQVVPALVATATASRIPLGPTGEYWMVVLPLPSWPLAL